jgi:dTDP-4-amino-4,6-dideoxygalactose transaminase
VVTWGYNSRLDNIQAAILDYKLSKYDQEISRRREIASIYQAQLSGIEQLLLPPAPDADLDHFDIFQNYEVECDERDALRIFLDENGVKTIIQWGGKCIHQFKDLGLNDDVPYTESMSRRYFLLPMNTSLLDDDIYYICQKINDFYRIKA